MQHLHLSDIGWIAFGLALYLFATSRLPAAIVRQVRVWFGRAATLPAPQRRPRPPLPIHRIPYRAVVRQQPEPVRMAVEPAEPGAVRAHLHQVEPAEPAMSEPAAPAPRLYRLSRIEEIALLAVQRKENGDYRHSANDITKLMGGTAAEVKKQIADIREPKPDQPEAKAAGRVDRPPRGWVNSASVK